MVQRTLPCIVQPSKGVLRDFDLRFAGVVGPLGLGVEDDHIGIAAHGERAAAFQIQAAPPAGRSTDSVRGPAAASTPGAASGGERPRAVSRPMMPFGARSNSTSFSWTAWGAWSVAMASMMPSRMPSIMRVAVGGGAQRRTHFGVGVVEADMLFGEQKMMRGDFAGDAKAVAAGLAHGGERGGGRDVGDVQVRARLRAVRSPGGCRARQCRIRPHWASRAGRV